jgi:lysophospholipase L1-like esterase
MGNSRLKSDSIHSNDAGYTIMAERFNEAMKPYL